MENILPTQKKGLSNGVRIALIYVVSIVLGVVLAQYLSKVYIYLFKPKPYLGFGDIGDTKNVIDGFLIGYIFFLSFFVALLLKNNKHRFWTWFAGIAVFLLIELGEWKHVGFDLLISLFGYLVGLGILFVKNLISTAKGK